MRHLRLAALFAGAFALAGVLSATQAKNADNGDWITIKGQVKMAAAPKPNPINVTTDREHCLSQGELVYEDLIVNPKTQGVKNVVVWLRPNSPDRRATFPQEKIHPDLAKGKVKPKNHEVDQPCCQFIPRVVAGREGDTFEFKNSAPVNHNVNYNSEAESFNINMPPNTSKKTQSLQAQATPITFKCDIHPWMQGRARVFDHPYFAVTDADGKFEIKLAPADRDNYRIMYWHENGFHKGRDGVLGFPLEGELKGDTLELRPIDLELPKN
jgi:plastocyanin